MAHMDALGRLFDIGLGWAPVDLNTADGATGTRISLARASGVSFVVATGVGGAENLTLDVQQHTAYTGGTTADLDVVTKFWIKAETALDNDESWVKVEQSAASECTVVGATYGTQQKLIVIEVDAASLSAGYSHVSLVASTTTATAHLAVCLYVVHDLAAQRTPSNLGNLLRPGAANA
jgi:hypothetical protein